MRTNNVRPQSLIFTLFGDYIRNSDERIRIGGLIKLLALFGLSAEVVRTTVSRMVRRGWLQVERVGHISYYSLTPAAKKVIEEGAARIFQFHDLAPPWNGCWQLVTYSIPEQQREARDRFRRELTWLGFGLLTNTVWLSPHHHRVRIEGLADSLHIKACVQLFEGRLDGFTPAPEVAARCWNLTEINAEYAAFIEKYEPPFRQCQKRLAAAEAMDQAECFVQRFILVHEYRRFSYRDPYLPIELLPRAWRGREAVALFREYHRLLADGANEYFEGQRRRESR
jgi:phenylacetic acid degradation operon negative regulatory protein